MDRFHRSIQKTKKAKKVLRITNIDSKGTFFSSSYWIALRLFSRGKKKKKRTYVGGRSPPRKYRFCRDCVNSAATSRHPPPRSSDVPACSARVTFRDQSRPSSPLLCRNVCLRGKRTVLKMFAFQNNRRKSSRNLPVPRLKRTPPRNSLLAIRSWSQTVSSRPRSASSWRLTSL